MDVTIGDCKKYMGLIWLTTARGCSRTHVTRQLSHDIRLFSTFRLHEPAIAETSLIENQTSSAVTWFELHPPPGGSCRDARRSPPRPGPRRTASRRPSGSRSTAARSRCCDSLRTRCWLGEVWAVWAYANCSRRPP